MSSQEWLKVVLKKILNFFFCSTGASVQLDFEAKPNSYIGITGIDQSVHLLKSGNDIEKDDVLNELRSYDRSNNHLDIAPIARRKRSLAWWPGSFTAQEVFDKSGAIILTNGYVHERSPWSKYLFSFSDFALLQYSFVRKRSTRVISYQNSYQNTCVRCL